MTDDPSGPLPRHLPAPTPGTRRLHLRTRKLLLAALAGLFAVLCSLVPFVWPNTDRPTHADAVIILSGGPIERVPPALRLMDSGVAPALVLVGTPDQAMEHEWCKGGRLPYEVVCLRPQPDNTREEARAAARLAEDRRWHSIVVVTATYHVTRAELLFRRCYDGRIALVAGRPAVGPGRAAHQIAREWMRVAYALTLERRC